MSRTPSVEDTANPSRRVALRALLILVAITVVLAAATAVYLFTRPTPYSGNWVGPGNFQGSGDPYAIEMYLSLEQKPFGGISGTGTLCAATGGTLGAHPVDGIRRSQWFIRRPDAKRQMQGIRVSFPRRSPSRARSIRDSSPSARNRPRICC